MNDKQPNDYHDQLIDQALREIVGGETPPDLTERILAAADARSTLVEYALSAPEVEKRSKRAWFSFATAACLLIAMGGFLFVSANGINALNRGDEVEQDLSQAQAKMSEIRKLESESENGGVDAIEEMRANWSFPGKNGKLWPADASGVQKPTESAPVSVPSQTVGSESTIDEVYVGTKQLGVSAQPSSKYPYQIELENLPSNSSPKRAPGQGKTFSPHYAPSKGIALSVAQKMDRESLRSDSYDATLAEIKALEDSPKNEKQRVLIEYRMRQQALEEQLRQLGGVGRNVQDPKLQKIRNELIANQRNKEAALAEIDTVPRARIAALRERLKAQSRDRYTRIYENPFIEAKDEAALSTFSIDVDTASYANTRQFLMRTRQLPPPDAVRLEELINYFDYDYTAPTDDTPFTAHVEVAGCPWKPEHRLVRIGIKGREIEREKRPQSNLVFLIDVSGSMNDSAKLPLLVSGMKLLTRQLGENDRVAIVVYASSEGLALPSTRGDQQKTILAALGNLRAGGSTAGGAGIQLAYQVAKENFIEGGTNRVILATDGDFNVGTTNTADLERLAEEQAKETGVFLTVLGFGRGNLNDAMMESISGKGNGNYYYVDNQTEARKVLVEEMSGTLMTIAKDVKIQVEFNPAKVAGYRLLGYENRMLEAKDFNDDKKDAGEIGAGHTVTALYEIVPAGQSITSTDVDDLKYQESPESRDQRLEENKEDLVPSEELLTLKLRYKQPDGDTSTKLEFPITDAGGSFAEASDDFKFAASVASFGMVLRNSEHRGDTSYAAVLEIAENGAAEDKHGYRAEFLTLVRRAKELAGE
ncbi:vWA domain-containing protein [Adhaeretor mobilis]|uniref:von Willebrand factor n=1 Tax=Adhaeretor mobilis TaxID=1930276 RepID=A0A517MUJ2_9BACT|nr:von Willebrand factor type A domain-containing protein [Adhaeretor mobilis]QDS98457.1 von Willebrand factor [Adhaeretor mobilis]